jgi:hypothetical protein
MAGAQSKPNRWALIDPALIANTASARHVQSVLEDAQATIGELHAALAAAGEALEAISEKMTLGERYTNAGQYLIDALPLVRAALANAQGAAS